MVRRKAGVFDSYELANSDPPDLGGTAGQTERDGGGVFARSSRDRRQTLQQLGWSPNRNLRIIYRWGAGNIEKIRASTSELLNIAPDVIVADGTPALRAFQQTATNIAIVFTIVSEPVAAGFVKSLAHPGGNITGKFSRLARTDAQVLFGSAGPVPSTARKL